MGAGARRDHPDFSTMDLLRSLTLSHFLSVCVCVCQKSNTPMNTHAVTHTLLPSHSHISLAGESTITVSVGHYALFPQ